jgi:hypothetical protein
MLAGELVTPGDLRAADEMVADALRSHGVLPAVQVQFVEHIVGICPKCKAEIPDYVAPPIGSATHFRRRERQMFIAATVRSLSIWLAVLAGWFVNFCTSAATRLNCRALNLNPFRLPRPLRLRRRPSESGGGDVTEAEERRRGLLLELRQRTVQFDNHPPQDVNGRQDILHAVRRVEAELRDNGGLPTDIEFKQFCAEQDAAEIEAKRVAAERSHDRRESQF